MRGSICIFENKEKLYKYNHNDDNILWIYDDVLKELVKIDMMMIIYLYMN